MEESKKRIFFSVINTDVTKYVAVDVSWSTLGKLLF